jgi:serine/threonine protein kinase
MPLHSGTPETDFGRRLEGRRLGQYEILERLGQGNMGVVYKAVHVELGKVVALKVLPVGVMQEISIARFKKEVRAIGRLDHPNIVGTHDAGQIKGIHFLVMSLLDGVDLARLMEQRGRLSISDACEVARQAAVGLHHAYGRNLVHRDVKPSNLMLTRDGQVKVLDLGLARSLGEEPVVERLTATGWILGTADYLAPEQWEDPHEVGTQADIYSLGCTLYHLIAGHPPFVGQQHSSVPKKMRAHLEVPAPPLVAIRPDVPALLDAVVLRMLAKNPADRYATPGDVADALRPFTEESNLAALVESADPAAANLPRPAAADSATDIARTTSKANERLSGHGSRPVWPSAWRRFGLPLAALCFCAMLAILAATWPGLRQSPSQHGSLKILGMGIRQYRGEHAEPLGDITATTHVIRADDTIRVSAKLNKPAYCYLIAFNPDGTEQLCYPEDPLLAAVIYPEHKESARAMIAPPAKTQEVQFPQDLFFEPGVAGLQAFVLIASSQPLPAYAQWRSQVGPIPWGPNAYRQTWRWRFDGQSFDPLPIERGKRVELGVPSEFKELCNFIQAHPQAEAVQALAFPVSGQ